MNRYQIRSEVRRIIRDSDYPKQDIDRAINSVLSSLNQVGKYRFGERYHDLVLVNGDKDYTMSNFVSEDAVVFQPASLTEESLLTKVENLTAGIERGYFKTTGSIPAYYAIWGDQMYLEPVPNATASGKTVRVYGYYDLGFFTNDLTVCDLPDKYCTSVLAWGAAAEINPTLVVDQGSRGSSIREVYNFNLQTMLAMERFEAKVQYGIQKDYRWRGLQNMGNVSRVRG